MIPLPEFIKHPEWFKQGDIADARDEDGDMRLMDNPPAEAIKAYKEYKALQNQLRAEGLEF